METQAHPPAQRLHSLLYRGYRLRDYLETVYLASAYKAQELGDSFGFTEVADDCLAQLTEINQELSEIHASLVYGQQPETLQALPGTVALAIHERAARWRPLLQSVPAVAAYLHCSGPEFHHLDVYAANEKRLNRPPRELRFEPLTTQRFPSEVIEIRRHCIAKAIANGQPHSEPYAFDDGREWRFRYTAVPLHGAEEVLCIVEDAADWQAGYWNN
jgi:hypothetical protein